MSPFTKWAYVAVQPFLDDAGIDTIQLLQDDFVQFGVNPELADQVRGDKNSNAAGFTP